VLGNPGMSWAYDHSKERDTKTKLETIIETTTMNTEKAQDII
jgi:hypothetical protein